MGATGEEVIQALQDLNVGDEIVSGCEVQRRLPFDADARSQIIDRVLALYNAESVVIFHRRDSGTKLWVKVARVVELGTIKRIKGAVERYECLKGLKRSKK